VAAPSTGRSTPTRGTRRSPSAGLGDASPLEPTDFERYHAEWVDPLSVDYRGYVAYGLPPNTQGLTALQILGLLDGFDVSSWGDGTTAY